ncbi:MAG: DUF4230 domain-containing protein [Clostridia bacterium]|nr:DUF4230 domain-containing protein [Clostridia bacterium]
MEQREVKTTEEKKVTREKNGENTLVTFLTPKKHARFLKGLVIGLIIGMLFTYVIGLNTLRGKLFNKVGAGKEFVDKLIDERLFGYTSADFTETILGEATAHQELIVMEQPLTVATTITKAGLGNWAMFSKTKNITYAGTGVYTVDLSKIHRENIVVDKDSKLVTVYIEHAELKYINIDYDRIEFENTENGFFTIGDIKFTAEQQNDLEMSVKEEMKKTLDSETLLADADRFAVLKAWETFSPQVLSMNPFYRVQVKFADQM